VEESPDPLPDGRGSVSGSKRYSNLQNRARQEADEKQDYFTDPDGRGSVAIQKSQNSILAPT
jgi:hypothetical protein